MRGRKRVSVETVSIEDLDPGFEQEYHLGVLQYPDHNSWRERMALERHWDDIDPFFGKDYDLRVLEHARPDDHVWRERMALERHWREEEFPLSPFPWERKLDIEDIERRERELDRDLLPDHLR